MKRTARSSETHGEEFKGVVKKITGRLTNDRALEEAGRDEMLGLPPRKGKAQAKRQPRRRLNPDPHRRG